MHKIRIGARKSPLSAAQVDLVRKMLYRQAEKMQEEIDIEFVPVVTEGDKILDKPLHAFEGKGMFVDEIEARLLTGDIDIAVHSAKDIPYRLKEGLIIAGVPKREDARDVLVTEKGKILPEHACIGTSSPRRSLQVKSLYPKAACRMLRGNVGTRIEKMLAGEYDAILLAAAGLKRLHLDTDGRLACIYLEPEQMVPSAGQGIIAIEGRAVSETGRYAKQDIWLSGILQGITDAQAKLSLTVERSIIEALGAGCHEPVGAYSRIEGNLLKVLAVCEREGKMRRAECRGKVSEWEAVVRETVGRLSAGI